MGTAQRYVGNRGAGDSVPRDQSSNAGEEIADRGEEDQAIDSLVELLAEQEGINDEANTDEGQCGGGSLDDRELPQGLFGEIFGKHRGDVSRDRRGKNRAVTRKVGKIGQAKDNEEQQKDRATMQ